MTTVQAAGPVVVLSDAEAGRRLAERLGPAHGDVACYASLEELVRERSLSTVEVLLFHGRQPPRGVLLARLGWLNLEYPEVQKVAVLEEAPALEVAEYLTACGVELVWGGEAEARQAEAASIVDRMRERQTWLTGYAPVSGAL